MCEELETVCSGGRFSMLEAKSSMRSAKPTNKDSMSFARARVETSVKYHRYQAKGGGRVDFQLHNNLV